VYCGRTDRLGRDHVPPRSLFGQLPPPNLITVPSCERCNNGAKKDDELFRLAFALREDNRGIAERDSAFASSLRSLGKPEARGLRQSVWKNVRVLPRVSPTGLLLPPGTLYTASGAPLDRVMKRVTKGLFYHEKGKRVPDDHMVKAIALSRLDELPPGMAELLENDVIKQLLVTRPTRLGTAFGYWQLGSTFGWARSFWLFEIYGRLQYFCTVAPKELPSGLLIGPPPPATDSYGHACIQRDLKVGLKQLPFLNWRS
jgi:hypothetical protein